MCPHTYIGTRVCENELSSWMRICRDGDLLYCWALSLHTPPVLTHLRLEAIPPNIQCTMDEESLCGASHNPVLVMMLFFLQVRGCLMPALSWLLYKMTTSACCGFFYQHLRIQCLHNIIIMSILIVAKHALQLIFRASSPAQVMCC